MSTRLKVKAFFSTNSAVPLEMFALNSTSEFHWFLFSIKTILLQSEQAECAQTKNASDFSTKTKNAILKINFMLQVRNELKIAINRKRMDLPICWRSKFENQLSAGVPRELSSGSTMSLICGKSSIDFNPKWSIKF